MLVLAWVGPTVRLVCKRWNRLYATSRFDTVAGQVLRMDLETDDGVTAALYMACEARLFRLVKHIIQLIDERYAYPNVTWSIKWSRVKSAVVACPRPASSDVAAEMCRLDIWPGSMPLEFLAECGVDAARVISQEYWPLACTVMTMREERRHPAGRFILSMLWPMMWMVDIHAANGNIEVVPTATVHADLLEHGIKIMPDYMMRTRQAIRDYPELFSAEIRAAAVLVDVDGDYVPTPWAVRGGIFLSALMGALTMYAGVSCIRG